MNTHTKTLLAQQADTLLALSREIERLESSLTYLAGAIASAAADGDTDSTVFVSLVNTYRDTRVNHATAKQAYTETLKGEN